MRKFLKYGGIVLGVLVCSCCSPRARSSSWRFISIPIRRGRIMPSRRIRLKRSARIWTISPSLLRWTAPIRRPRARGQPPHRGDASRASAIAPERFEVRLMQITALADNGHTQMRLFAPDRTPPMALPIRISRFADGFFVMRAKAPSAARLGGRVESIDGTPADKAVQQLETLRGGTAAHRRENVSIFGVLNFFMASASRMSATNPPGRCACPLARW